MCWQDTTNSRLACNTNRAYLYSGVLQHSTQAIATNDRSALVGYTANGAAGWLGYNFASNVAMSVTSLSKNSAVACYNHETSPGPKVKCTHISITTAGVVSFGDASNDVTVFDTSIGESGTYGHNIMSISVDAMPSATAAVSNHALVCFNYRTYASGETDTYSHWTCTQIFVDAASATHKLSVGASSVYDSPTTCTMGLPTLRRFRTLKYVSKTGLVVLRH